MLGRVVGQLGILGTDGSAAAQHHLFPEYLSEIRYVIESQDTSGVCAATQWQAGALTRRS